MRTLLSVLLLAGMASLRGQPAAVPAPAPMILELTAPPAPAPLPIELAQGSSVAPDGTTLSADSISLLRDGRPIMPIAGEFHYSRYPRDEWRTQLLRMKAQGISLVSTYVFWIHHQESPGAFEWSGQRDLRAFVALCGELGLQAVVRIGPWDHGEVRNGGLPDWVEHAPVKRRSTDPAFLALVRPFFAEIARQLDGLYWKNGGPIVAIQIENECDGPDYLQALKAMARELGIDAPWYTMTGWNGVRIPDSGFLPLFGAYSVAFWYPRTTENFKKSFFFTDIRDDGDMGAQFVNRRPHRLGSINRFPYLCCEIGGGMPSSYTKRIRVAPEEIAAMALVKLGNGSNMPGYYMYQGGLNPDGRLSFLHEAAPNPMPVKDYDFQAPLAATGLARPHAALLRRQHLFLAEQGARLARMPLMLPVQRPESIHDTTTVRWAVRHDGVSGFLFLNNYQPVAPLSAHRAVQFTVRAGGLVHRIPAEPAEVPAGTFGILPLDLPVGGLLLRHATVDPLATLSAGPDTWHVFGEIAGLRPELALDAEQAARVLTQAPRVLTGEARPLAILHPAPGRSPVLSWTAADGGRHHLLILPASDATQLHRVRLRGAEALAITPATLHQDGDRLVLESLKPGELTLAVFIPALHKGGDTHGGPLFVEQRLPNSGLPARAVSPRLLRPAPSLAQAPDGRREEAWEQAEEWDLSEAATPPAAGARHLIRLHYQGDAARLYVDGRLYLDNFYNGDPLDLPLWRLPAGARLTLRILPLTAEARDRLPPELAHSLGEAPMAPSAELIAIQSASAAY